MFSLHKLWRAYHFQSIVGHVTIKQYQSLDGLVDRYRANGLHFSALVLLGYPCHLPRDGGGMGDSRNFNHFHGEPQNLEKG